MTNSAINCLNCNTEITASSFFYTLARNSYMFGFFCCQDCAATSEHNRYLGALVLKVRSSPESHRELVIVPDLKMLKQYKEESERRDLRKKYFG